MRSACILVRRILIRSSEAANVNLPIYYRGVYDDNSLNIRYAISNRINPVRFGSFHQSDRARSCIYCNADSIVGHCPILLNDVSKNAR